MCVCLFLFSLSRLELLYGLGMGGFNDIGFGVMIRNEAWAVACYDFQP